MTKIAYFVHGRGRGHAVRSASVVDRIVRELETTTLHLFADSEERDRFEPYGEFNELESVPRGLATFSAIHRLRKHYTKVLGSLEIDLVVSDGDPASLLAARAAGVPSLAVGHNVLFTRARMPESISTIARLYECANAWLSTAPADYAVAASFVSLTPKDERTIVARPDPRWRSEPSTERGNEFLAYFRDGDDGGVIQKLVNAGQKVRVYGDFRGDLPERATHMPFDDQGFLRDLASCRGVVATGGSNLITEAIYLRKPIFAVYKKLDMEQRINVAMLREAGLGDGCAMNKVSSRAVRRFVDNVDQDTFETIELKNLLPTVSESVIEQIRAVIRSRG